MTEHQTRNGGASRSATPPPQGASGTVRRSDLRPRAPRPTAVGWPLIVAGLLIGVLAVAWILAGGSSPQVVIVAGASGSPASTPATTAASSLSSAVLPSPSSTSRIVRASPTTAPSIVPETLRPTQPRPTQPPPSQPAGLTIVFPTDGEVLRHGEFNVVGTGPPGATVTRDIPLWFDDHLIVRADGNWLMPVSLGEGENVLRFRIGDDRSTEWVVTVTFQPRG